MKILVLLLLLNSFSFALAHHHEGHEVVIATELLEKDFEALSDSEQKEVLNYLLQGVHNAAEIESDHANKIVRGLQDFLNKFKFKSMYKGGLRWYSHAQKKHPGFAADLALIFPLSHTLEIALGTMAVPIAQYFGATSIVSQTIAGTAGGLIMLPGLDPLCWILFLSYPTITPFRKAVRATRLTLLKIPKYLGVNTFFRWMFQNESSLAFLNEAFLSQKGIYKYTSNSDPSHIKFNFKFNDETKHFLKTKFLIDGDKLTLIEGHYQSQQLLSLSEQQMLQLKSQLSAFNWSTRDALLDAVKKIKKGKISQLNSEYHIEHIHKEIDHYKIEFKPHSVVMNPKLTRTEKFKNFCNRYLKL